MTLDELNDLQFAKIHRILGGGNIRARLMDMGFVHGEVIEVIRRAPLSGPIEVRIKGTLISLRPEEARLVEVFPIRWRHRGGGRHNHHEHRFLHRMLGFFRDDRDNDK